MKTVMKTVGLWLAFAAFIGISSYLVITVMTRKIARSFGGSITIKIDKDKRVVTSSWKGDSLWVLTRPAKEGEAIQTLTYREYSSMGVLEGEVILEEQK